MNWFKKAVALNYNDPENAIEYLNKAIKLQPKYVDAYHLRGINYVKLKQCQRAIDDFNKIISLKPDNAEAYISRGMFILSSNKKLGCPDAEKACDLGNCKLSEMAKNKGYCR